MEQNDLLFIWYDYRPKSRFLCINLGYGVVQWLREQGHFVAAFHIGTTDDNEKLDGIIVSGDSFDYILAVDIVELSDSIMILSSLNRHLNPDGIILLGMHNRLGIKYFCGEKDPFTGGLFDGPENYLFTDNKPINRCYSQAESRRMLDQAGINHFKYYSVFPDLSAPSLIVSENYLPNEKMGTRLVGRYFDSTHIIMHEGHICDALIENGIFHQMADSYLVECSLNSVFSNVNAITLSSERSKEEAMITLVYPDVVIKRAIYPSGIKTLKNLAGNIDYLKQRGVNVVEGHLRDFGYEMPYFSSESANTYIHNCLLTDVELFIKRVDDFRDLIIQSSPIIRVSDDTGPILEKGFMDLVPLNCFWDGDHYVVFDQEFCVDELPLNVILWRTLIIIYDNPAYQKIVPITFFLERYDMIKGLESISSIERSFINSIHCMTENKLSSVNPEMIKENRTRLEGVNIDLYKETCFSDIYDTKVYVFGAGNYAEKFISMYGNELEISGIIDNDLTKWGKVFCGFQIKSPEVLTKEAEKYKVVVCVKDYTAIIEQLEKNGVTSIGIYDAHYIYEGRQSSASREINRIADNHSDHNYTGRRYTVGYISGVFDLFHIGHVNILRRAKERCDYLIVGVTSDEYVRTRKNKNPIIPFDERIEVLKSCRYVDEVVGVPYKFCGTIEAFEKYHFDIQFCGSDYADNGWWLEQKAWLEEHGATIVFLPYTETTCSTMIRDSIKGSLETSND
ncbi:cytidyltransferase-like domain-containing protein [Lachnospiraceae bacterium XBB2008]|nr:cytidyltransferase-like domain-containing protein [Lachnospiraceae bacterium XBB2008]